MKKPEQSLDERLQSLETKLASNRKQQPEIESESRSQKDSTGFAYALRLSTEFIVAILVGAAIGWGIDKFFGTTPWAMIGLLFIGFCAGVLNVMRTAGMVAENRALKGEGIDSPEWSDKEN